MHLVQTTPPSIEPLSLSDAKTHCNVDNTHWDSMFTFFITTARQWVEQYCLNSLITQTYTVTYDYHDTAEWLWSVKRKIRLPQTPIQSVTSITHYDRDNTATVFDSSNYFLSGDRVILNDANFWPSNLRLHDCMKIIFISGFGSLATNVPTNIILAMKMLIASWYEIRESLSDDVLAKTNMQLLPVPFGVTSLLSKYKVPVIL